MTDIIATGSCGIGISYEIRETDSDVSVIVSGIGEMTDYPSEKESPFYAYKEKITSVIIGHGITGIGDYAFCDCESLTSVKIADTVKYLGASAFMGCVSITTLRLPEGVEIIGPKALSKCKSLKKVYLPSTLKAVDFKAFKGSDSLAFVKYNGSREQWNRCVKVAVSSIGALPLEKAEFTYTNESSIYRKTVSRLAKIIKDGGDGKLHFICPNLTVPNTEKKSGEFTIIIFPHGSTMMIDSGVAEAESRVISLISGLKLGKLDYFVLTHPHSDHYGNAMAAMKYIIENNGGRVLNYMYSGYKTERHEPYDLCDYLRSTGTQINTCVREGDALNIDGVDIRVFNPDEKVLARVGKGAEFVNDTSISFKLTFGNFSAIMSGDLYADREIELAEKFGSFLKADVIKTNHHGLYTSSTREWFDTIKPKAVISEDDGADCTRLDMRLKKDGIKIYKVSERGLVVLTADETGKFRFKTEY